MSSFGGGTGQYQRLDGDLPTSLRFAGGALNAAKSSDGGSTTDMYSIILEINGKNVQSLHAKHREEELLTELGTIKWDVVLLSETWREELRKMEDGRWTPLLWLGWEEG